MNKPDNPHINKPESPPIDKTDRPRIDRPERPRIDRPERPRIDRTECSRIDRTESSRIDRTERPRIDRTESSRIDRTERPRIDRTESSRIGKTDSKKENPRIGKIEIPLIIKENKQKKYFLLFDSLMIFLNLSNSYSIIPYLLFFQYNRVVNIGIIIIINVFYLLFRFRKIRFPYKDALFIVYFLISIANIFSSIYSDTMAYQTGLYLLSNTTFYIILYNCYNSYIRKQTFEKSSWLIIRGCVWLSLLSVVGAALLFIYIQIGGNPIINDVGKSMDLFVGNVDQFNTSYHFPYISIISSTADIRIPFFQQEGIICGLYHEPHIIAFMTFPALFMLLGRLESVWQKNIILLLYILIMLVAASTTNIGAFLVCLMFLFFKNKRLLITLIIIACGVFYLSDIDFSDFLFIGDKMIQSGSKDYSMNTILFAFSPKTLLGSNFLRNDYLHSVTNNIRDVGYLSFTLNIIFLSVFSYKIFQLILVPKNKWRNMIGIAALYFFLHSMKVAMVTYSLSYLLFIMFLITIFTRIPNRNYSYSLLPPTPDPSPKPLSTREEKKKGDCISPSLVERGRGEKSETSMKNSS